MYWGGFERVKSGDLVPNSICLRRDAKFWSGLVVYREKSELYEPLDQVLRSHSCEILKI